MIFTSLQENHRGISLCLFVSLLVHIVLQSEPAFQVKVPIIYI